MSNSVFDVDDGLYTYSPEAISKDAKLSFQYAFNILKDRFPEGEAAIATACDWSFYYALKLRARFHKGEAAIATDSFWSFHYALEILHARFPEGEAAIAKDACLSFRYANEVIKGRFHAGEEIIKEDAGCAYLYAREVLKAFQKKTPNQASHQCVSVNVGFTSITMACKICGKEMSH
jgi:hypothetical protein